MRGSVPAGYTNPLGRHMMKGDRKVGFLCEWETVRDELSYSVAAPNADTPPAGAE